jgi:erythromycin esterase-like protein
METERTNARPLNGAAQDCDPLLDLAGDAHLVLLGEASHGTHAFTGSRSESQSISSRRDGNG